jgi:hypothetical protein
MLIYLFSVVCKRPRQLQCPHCSVTIHESFNHELIKHHKKEGHNFVVFYDVCPACKDYIIYLKFDEPSKNIDKFMARVSYNESVGDIYF